jgi:general secretion pathway protein B
MSYILDALRKAEKDRNLGRTPSLGDVTSHSGRASSETRGPSTRTLVLIALVLVMLVLAIVLWPRAPVVAPATEVAAVAPPPAASSPPAPAPLERTPAPVVPATDPNVDPGVAAESIDDLLDDSAAVPPPDEPLLDEGATFEAEAPARPAVKPAPVPAPAPVAESPPSAPPVVTAAPAPESNAIASTPAEVPPLRDMPSDYRGAFPELRIDVHVYDANPARRWALINGKKAVEGTALSEGPTVAEIVPDGIVFDFRGRKSLFSLKR